LLENGIWQPGLRWQHLQDKIFQATGMSFFKIHPDSRYARGFQNIEPV